MPRSSRLASRILLDQRTRDRRPFKILDFLTPGQVHALARYEESYRPIVVQKSFVLASAGPADPLNTMALHRSHQFPERAWLPMNLLRRFLVQAHGNAVAVARMGHELALLRKAVDKLDRGVVVLTRNGRIQLATARARQWLAEYFASPSATDRLPEALRRWLRQQKTSLSSAAEVPSWEVLVVHSEGKRLVVRLLSDSDQTFLLFEQHMRVQPAFLESLRLTRREAEVLAEVAEGENNIEIGIHLHMSPGTAKKHLENIYRKLGVETRMAAAARALKAATEARTR